MGTLKENLHIRGCESTLVQHKNTAHADESKKRILRLAVQKARDNGLTHFVGETEGDFAKFLTLLADEHIDVFFDRRELWALVLYDNCFCRAFWGTQYVIPIGKVWQYHRRTMLFSKDPFGYIAWYL